MTSWLKFYLLQSKKMQYWPRVEKFPWLNDNQVKRLEEQTINVPLEQKASVQQELYRNVLPVIIWRKFKEDRLAMKNQVFNQALQETDIQKQNRMQSELRKEDLADLVKEKRNLIPQAPTESVFNSLIKEADYRGIDHNLLNDYLAGRSEEFLYEMELKERPTWIEHNQPIQDWSRFWLLRPQDKERNDNYFWKMKATEQDLNADTLDYLWWFIKNVGKSAVNLASDVGNAVLNPIDTANNILKLGAGSVLNAVGLDDRAGEKSEWLNEANKISDGMGEHIKKRFWSREAFSKAAYEDPVGLFSDLSGFTSLGANVLKAGAKLTAKAGARAGVNTSLLSKAGDIAGDVAKVADSIDPATHLMNGAGEIIKWGIGKAVELGKNVLDKTGISDKLNLDAFVGLDKQTKKGIQNNPYTQEMRERSKNWIEENGIPAKSQEVAKDLISELQNQVTKEFQGMLSQFWETWPLYEKLKKSWGSVNIDPIKWSIKELLEENGVKIGENWLDFSRTSISDTEARAISRVYNWIDEVKTMDASEYLRFRKSIDEIWLRENKKGSTGNRILKEIRKINNENAHNQIPGLSELDDAFSKQAELYKKFTEGLVYKDKKRYGEWRDNLNQILKNLDTPNRERMAQRVEELMPGITQKVEAINLMPKLIDNYYATNKTAESMQNRTVGLTAWALGFAWGGLGTALGTASIGWLLSKGYNKLKQSRWNKVISSLSDEGKTKLQEIEAKILSNKNLAQDQEQYLRGIAEKIENTETKKVVGGREPTTTTNENIINNSSQKSKHSYQKVDGSIIEHIQGAKTTNRDFLKRQFSNKIELPLTDDLKQKTQLVDLIKIGELEKWSLGDVPAIAFNDGKVRPLELSTSIYEKIFKKHGPFNHENLIATANNWDYLIKNLGGTEGHINLLKELPEGKALLIGARRENGAFLLTHFEPTKSLEDVLKDAKEWGAEVISKQSLESTPAKKTQSKNKEISEEEIIEKYRQRAIKELWLPEGTTSINWAELQQDKKRWEKYHEIQSELEKELGYLSENGTRTKKWHDYIEERKKKVYGEQKSSFRED